MRFCKVVVLLLMVTVIGLGATPASAADIMPYAGVSYNTVDMQSLNAAIELVNELAGTDIPTIDNAIGFVGGVNIETGMAVSVGLELEHLRFGTSYSEGGNSLEFAGSSTGLAALARYVARGGDLSVYAGPVYHFGGMTTQSTSAGGPTDETEFTGSGLGFKAGVGLTHSLSDSAALQVRAGYRSLEYDVESDEVTGEDTLGLTGVELQGGLSFRF